MKSVLFVCSGNTCRSPMVAALLRHDLDQRPSMGAVNVHSAGLRVGVELPLSECARRVLSSRGISPAAHRSKLLTQRMLDDCDLLFCMTPLQRQAIENDFRPGLPIHLLGQFCLPAVEHIADPHGKGIGTYGRILQQFQTAIPAILGRIKSLPE